ncbi:MAG TPA: biopolymer transporter ExbD [Isosphaeraceae bacterium]|jgi:biopolymer transport protein ExbD
MLLRRQINEPRDEHIDMTPMVDVVFQLMTFMLVSMQLRGAVPVEVPPARHGLGIEEAAATVLTLPRPRPVATGSEPKVVLGLGDGPAATPEQIRRYVADGVARGRRKVILQADGAVPHGAVLKVAAALAELEGITLHVGVQEAP